eukprot:1250302-Rhodomonas_salina.2
MARPAVHAAKPHAAGTSGRLCKRVTRLLCQVRYGHAIGLHLCYAVSETDSHVFVPCRQLYYRDAHVLRTA